MLRVVGVMREGVNEAHFNPLHSHSSSGESDKVKANGTNPTRMAAGRDTRGLSSRAAPQIS